MLLLLIYEYFINFYMFKIVFFVNVMCSITNNIMISIFKNIKDKMYNLIP